MARANDKTKLFQVPVTGGINQAVDDRDAPPGTLVKVDNCRIKKSLLVQRPGFDAVSLSNVDSSSMPLLGDGVTTYVEKPALVAAIDDMPVVALTNGRLYGAHSESGTEWFGEIGYTSTCKPLSQRSNVSQYVDPSVQPASAINASGYRAVAWLSNPPNVACQVMCAVSSPEGKPIAIVVEVVTTSVDRIVLIAQGDMFILLWAQAVAASNSVIKVKRFQVASGVLTVGSGDPRVLLTMSSAATVYFDATAVDATYWALVAASSGDASLKAYKFTSPIGSAPSSVASTTISLTAATAGAPRVSCRYDADYSTLWLGYTDWDTSVFWGTYTIRNIADLSEVKAPTKVTDGFAIPHLPLIGGLHGRALNTETSAFWIASVAAMRAQFGVQTLNSFYNKRTIENFRALSRPDGRGRFWAVLSDDTNPAAPGDTSTYWYVLARPQFRTNYASFPPLIVELTVGPFVASPDVLADIMADAAQFFSVAVGNDFCTAALLCNLGTAVDVREIVYATSEQDPHLQTARTSPSIVTAGQPTEHLGGAQGIVSASTFSFVDKELGGAEVGFPEVPLPTFNVTSGGSGSPTGAGTRSYRVVFSWTDRYGRKHTSAPSLPVQLTLDATQYITVGCSPGSLGQRADVTAAIGLGVVTEVYSTVDGGTEFFLAGVVDASNQFLQRTDLELESQPILYTDGGVLPNMLAPSCTFQVFSDDRLWVGGGFQRNVVTCSKIIIPQEPIQFTDSEAFEIVVPGDVTALGFLDGTVIAFTETAIYQIAGSGPNDQGVGEFSGPTLIWAGVGCINHKSLVKTDDGLIYQAAQGFYLLPRGLGAPQFIGANVRDETQAYPNCLGAALTQTENYYLARFLMAAAGSTSSGIVLVFDVLRQVWFKDTITSNGTAPILLSEIGAWPDGLVLMRESMSSADTGEAALLLEDETRNLDGLSGAVIGQNLETAWVYPFQLGGYGHVRKCQIAVALLGTSASLVLSVETDASSTPQTATWSVSGAAGDVIYRELQLSPTQATCAKITLNTSSTAGGVRPVSCTLEVDDDFGIRLLSAAERQ